MTFYVNIGTYYSNYQDTTATAKNYFSDMFDTTYGTDNGTACTGTTSNYNLINTYNHTGWQTYTVPYTVPFNVHQNNQPLPDQYYQDNIPNNIPQSITHQGQETKEEIEASQRAKNLLLEYLDEDNKQKFYNNKNLEIASRLFKDIKYHIPLSRLGRIKALKNGNVITELCLLVKEIERLPVEDVLFTKLMHIMNDEANMLRTANHFNVKENLLLCLN